MINKFHVLYVGQIELDNIGLAGTPANDRRYSDERLREAFFSARDIAQTMDDLGFDVRALSLVASGPGGFTIGLDPGVASPGAGVLNVAGQFLIPTLFLRLDDGLTLTDLALANVTGTLTPSGPGCAYGYCLETGEEIGIKRLEARPVATLSVEAQERRERREKQYGDRDDRYR